MIIRSYKELRRLTTFKERFDYLKLNGVIGEMTFGFDRYLNQMIYTSQRWKKLRDEVIIRDKACDLGIEGQDVHGKIFIHHMNVVTIEDIELERDYVYDPEFLICTSFFTHNAIHFGNESLLPRLPVERKKNDTCPWRK